MKLSELKPQSCALNIGSVQLHLRYDMNALLKLEQVGFSYLDIFDVTEEKAITEFLAAGLIENIGRERAANIVEKLSVTVIKTVCEAAMILALPEYDPTIIPDTKSGGNSDGFDFAKLRSMLCDEMGKPEELFWSSTIREIYQRWEAYAELKGYSKPVERMEMYDTEGM